jgi:hypothetical protein
VTPTDVSTLWDPDTVIFLDAPTQQGAEQAFSHFLDDPQYFVDLYADPAAWRESEEWAYLDIFAQYSTLHTYAEDLVTAELNDDTATHLWAANFHYGAGDESGTEYFIALAGVSDLVAAAERDYPSKATRPWEWHHYVPKYLGGDPNGTRYYIPAPYHQYITNEFRQWWAYGQGKPTPEHLQYIMNQVYTKYPIPQGSERR